MVRKDVIREKILGLGADVCGFGGMERFTDAPINFRPIDLYPDCKSVIAVGIALPNIVAQLSRQKSKIFIMN